MDSEKGIILYTVEDVSKLFGLGRTKTYQLMAAPGFPSFRLNRKVYITKENLEKWIRDNRGKTYHY